MASQAGTNEPKIFAPVERCFRADLPATGRFLSWQMKWHEWGAQPNESNWWYAPVDPEIPSLSKVARDLYQRIDGNGYCRLDLRMNSAGDIFVVDVNANCALDVDEGTAMRLILQQSGLEVKDLLRIYLDYGIWRATQKSIS